MKKETNRKRLKIVNPHRLIGWQVDQNWTVNDVSQTADEWVFQIHNTGMAWIHNIFLDKFSREDGRWWFNRRGVHKSLVGYDITFFHDPQRMILRLQNEMRAQNIIKD